MKAESEAEKNTERITAESGEKNGGGNRGNSDGEREYKRNAKGQFTKGTKGGNPSGRPKMPINAKQMLVAMLPKALETVQSMIDDEKVKPDIRMRAAELVIERNLGKAVTPVLTETVGEGSTLTLAEMIACAKDLLNAE